MTCTVFCVYLSVHLSVCLICLSDRLTDNLLLSFFLYFYFLQRRNNINVVADLFYEVAFLVMCQEVSYVLMSIPLPLRQGRKRHTRRLCVITANCPLQELGVLPSVCLSVCCRSNWASVKQVHSYKPYNSLSSSVTEIISQRQLVVMLVWIHFAWFVIILPRNFKRL